MQRVIKWTTTLVDTTSDICCCNQGIENTSHFLFECPFFATQRVTLACSAIYILHKNNLVHLGNELPVYLYGNNAMRDDDNKTILKSTIKYIKDTKRFSN